MRSLLTLLIVFALSIPAEAQQAKKIPRIGILTARSGALETEAFRDGLRELGYIEGQNLVMEYRSADDRLEQLPDLAAELVRLKVDVIVAQSTPATIAAKNATKTIPIIMAGSIDPVATGVVPSLARPGGNITGVTVMNEELAGKRLELLKETNPKVSHVAVLWNPANSGAAVVLKQTQTAAKQLSLPLESLEIRSVNDLQGVFEAATRSGANALVVLRSVPISDHLKVVADLAIKDRLPSIHDRGDFVEAGGLMSYGPNLSDMPRRAAIYVDKVLKGAKPAELPVERPTKFELIINLKTAKQIGLTIPPNVLLRADKVIK